MGGGVGVGVGAEGSTGHTPLSMKIIIEMMEMGMMGR